MGGLSSGKISVNNDKALFSGNISFKNNGGFLMLKTQMNTNLTSFSGGKL